MTHPVSSPVYTANQRTAAARPVVANYCGTAYCIFSVCVSVYQPGPSNRRSPIAAQCLTTLGILTFSTVAVCQAATI
jgi:hypothetical protein